ncbi:GIY-YIG nuclease family protein [Aliarcobacter vitoriensis]|uniref:GIY-YIG nuclease family protein n=1 Tax=Aliarcobacter vitoriensis TaxID=2011099 RepID=UPI003AAF0FBF
MNLVNILCQNIYLDIIQIMRNISFYIIINKLYNISLFKYIKYLKEEVLNTQWFKKACKEKKIVVKYLSKDYFTNLSSNIYLKYDNNKSFFYKLFLLKFEYKNKLEDNNHLKLLNINIVNESRFYVINYLLNLQKGFLDTNHFFNMKIICKEEFINNYKKIYNRYLDKSILSRILTNTYFLFNKSIHKISHLIPKNRFIYSIYIKDIINNNFGVLKSDNDIANILYEKYGIKLTRRVVCDIRNQYLIPKIREIDVLQISKFFSSKKVLNKKNISLLSNNIQGVYEISSNKDIMYPFLKNKVIYIGSSKNLKKRLKTYTTKYVHIEEIKNILEKGDVLYFRFFKSFEYRDFERKIINHFIYFYGDLPKLNTQRIIS